MLATVDWTNVKLGSWLPVKEPDTCSKPVCRARPLLVIHMLGENSNRYHWAPKAMSPCKLVFKLFSLNFF